MPELPLPAKFFIAFVIVLALIGGVAWLVRRFGAGALNPSLGRGRQSRLGVIEAAAVDTRRRLVLVRRDNVEHLIMLGGPTDLVVEANIVRAHAAPVREPAPARAPEPAHRPGAEEGLWPPVPEPAFRAPRGPERSPVPPSVVDDLPLQPHPEPAPRVPSGDKLSGLAAELGRAAPRSEPTPPPRPAPEPPRRQSEPRRAPAAAAPARAAPEEAQASDRHLAAMAQQLEAALRRPGAAAGGRENAPVEPPAPAPAARRPATEPRPAPEPEPREPRSSLLERARQSRSNAAQTPPRARPTEPADARSEAEESATLAAVEVAESAPPPPAPDAAAPREEPALTPGEPSVAPPAEADAPAEAKPQSLEEEMANLLGRSPGRT